MKQKFKVSAICGLSVLLASGSVLAETAISGNLELDTDYVSNRGGAEQDDFVQGGRVLVEFSGTKEADSGGYVKAVGQLLVKKDGTAGVDDAYIRIGKNQWGLQFGRFEALELFALGTDTLHVVIGNTNFFRAATARGRVGDNIGQIMFDYQPSDSLRLELGTVWGEEDDPNVDESAFAGIRPGITFGITDSLSVTAGYEMVTNGEEETSGGAVKVEYATDAFTLKLSAASGERETDSVTDWENTSYNVNVDVGPFGVGYTATEDDGGDSASTVYGHYTMADLLGTGVSGTLGFSLASADSVDEDELGIRYRFNYAF